MVGQVALSVLITTQAQYLSARVENTNKECFFKMKDCEIESDTTSFSVTGGKGRVDLTAKKLTQKQKNLKVDKKQARGRNCPRSILKL